MSTELNKAIVREMVEKTNRGDAEGAVACTSPECLLNGEPFGREGDLQRTKMFATAFPDGKWTIEDMVAEGNSVAVRYTFEGTHLGPFGDIPPSKNSVKFSGISLYRMTGGMFSQIWEGYDKFDILQQLGAIPPMAS